MSIPLLINGFRVQMLWSAQNGGRPWSTKFDYVQVEGGSTDIGSLAAAFLAKLETTWTGTASGGLRSNFASTTLLQVVRFYRLVDPLQGFDLPPTTSKSGAATTLLPAEVAVVASLRTPFLGRRFRGRQYWGGLSTNAVNNTTGRINGLFRTDLQDFVSGFGVLEAGTNTFVHSVISGQGSTAPRPPGLANPVTQVLVDAFPDTQRRRGGR
jgi:hypothetical protein